MNKVKKGRIWLCAMVILCALIGMGCDSGTGGGCDPSAGQHIITTYAGTGVGGYSGDGGQAGSAQLAWPRGVAVDKNGNLYFSDYENHIVRKVDTDGIITTIAGTPGLSGYSGEATVARPLPPGFIGPRVWPWIPTVTCILPTALTTLSARWIPTALSLLLPG